MQTIFATIDALTRCTHVVAVEVDGIRICTQCGAYRTHPNGHWWRPELVKRLEHDTRDEIAGVDAKLGELTIATQESAVAIQACADNVGECEPAQLAWVLGELAEGARMMAREAAEFAARFPKPKHESETTIVVEADPFPAKRMA